MAAARKCQTTNERPVRCWMCGQILQPKQAWTQTLISFLGNPAPWRCLEVDACLLRYVRLQDLALKWPEPFCSSRSMQDCLRFLVASGVTPEVFAAATEAYLRDVEVAC